MALYYLCQTNLSRKKGRSSVSAAAYRSGEKLIDERNGLVHDYTYKGGIVHKEILLPEGAPPEFHDRQTLWNAVERMEKRRDSRTAREIVIALPRELTLETSISLARSFAEKFVELGMCADIAVHRGDRKDRGCIEGNHLLIHPHNPHCHILLTTRHVTQTGFCDKKAYEWENWGKSDLLKQWREDWANIQNRILMLKGLDVRVSHESYKTLGIDREPGKHLGPALASMEQRGVRTRKGNENRAIQIRNRVRERGQQGMEHHNRGHRELSR